MRDVRPMSSQAAKLFSRVGDYENRRSCRVWVAQRLPPDCSQGNQHAEGQLFFAGLRMLEPSCAVRTSPDSMHGKCRIYFTGRRI